MAIELIIIPLLGYLLGSIPTSVWIGRIFFGKDVRDYGSGNAGATNTIRVLGWKAGSVVVVMDTMKGWLAVYLAGVIGNKLDPDLLLWLRIIAGLAAVLGHVFPLFAGFRGGKGVATFLGVGIALFPVTVWIVVAVFFLILFTTGYVSLASVLAAFSFPFIDIFIMGQSLWPLMLLSILVGIVVPLTHHKNIRRLVQGEESKFLRKKKKESQ